MNWTEATPLQIERYWRAVELCLNKFHSHWPDDAERAVAAYRDNLQAVMEDPELIYHEEPFYLACDIADEDLPFMEYRDEYDAILKELLSLPA